MQGSDAALVSRVLAGDVGAFNVLARRWQKPVYNFVLRYTGHVEEAEDVSQEAFVRAYTQLRRLKDPERFGSWLHAIAYRLCQDRGRRRQRRIEVSSEDLGESGLEAAAVPDGAGTGLEAGAAGPAELAEAKELGELLERALARLPDEQRVALVLRELQGYTSNEIARLLGVPAPTVRSRIFYGLKSMRRMLGHHALSRELFSS